MKIFTAFASLTIATTAPAALVLTEIDLTTGQIEVTNTDSSAFSGTLLEWCRPFNYGTMESGGFTFAAGESRVYTMSVSNLTADDVWIYLDRSGGFGNEQFVTTGIVFGSNQAGIGRVNNVVNDTSGAAWAQNTDFVDTTGLGAGQTLQLNPGAPLSNTSANWGIAASDLGSYAVPEPSAVALLFGGVAALGLRRRRR